MTKADCKDFVTEALKFIELLDSTIIKGCNHRDQTPWESAAYYPAVRISGSLKRLVEICKED